MPKGVILTPEEQTRRRLEIVAIALRLFDENGFQNTSLRKIAEAAQMGKSSLYDFFKTKDEIVVYALEQEMTIATIAARKIATDEALPGECLRKLMQAHMHFAIHNKSIIIWLNTEAIYLKEEYQHRLLVAREAYREVVSSVIERGIAIGEFRKTDTALATRLLVNSMLSIVFVPNPSAVLEEVLEESICIFLHGILKKNGGIPHDQ